MSRWACGHRPSGLGTGVFPRRVLLLTELAVAFSADGRFVAFYSDASNLVAGDTNEDRDVFVRDPGTS